MISVFIFCLQPEVEVEWEGGGTHLRAVSGSRLEMFFKIGFSKFRYFLRKTPVWNFYLMQLQACVFSTLFKEICEIFKNIFFFRTPLDDCFRTQLITSFLGGLSQYRSSHRCSMKEGVLRNLAKFTGKHLCQSLFFNKAAGLRPAFSLKEKLWYRCFPVNFCKIFKNTFLQNA